MCRPAVKDREMDVQCTTAHSPPVMRTLDAAALGAKRGFRVSLPRWKMCYAARSRPMVLSPWGTKPLGDETDAIPGAPGCADAGYDLGFFNGNGGRETAAGPVRTGSTPCSVALDHFRSAKAALSGRHLALPWMASWTCRRALAFSRRVAEASKGKGLHPPAPVLSRYFGQREKTGRTAGSGLLGAWWRLLRELGWRRLRVVAVEGKSGGKKAVWARAVLSCVR